ncbi:MAG: adenylate/guanylate cyclase domain-containing protein [Fimbriimonadaceae bacterium]
MAESIHPSHDAVSAFITELREHPGMVTKAPAEIAERFGLEEQFVNSVIDAIQSPEDSTRQLDFQKFIGGFCALFVNGWRGARDILKRITAKPVPFIVGSFIAMASYFVLVALSPLEGTLKIGALNIGILLGIVLQLICLFRHGKARYGVLAGGLAALTNIVTIGVTNNFFRNYDPSQTPIYILGLSITGFAYGILGIIVSVSGAYLASSRETRADRNLTRQELLDRVFQLETRFKEVSKGGSILERPKNLIDRARSLRSFYVLSGGVGLFLSMIDVAVLGSYTQMVGVSFEQLQNGADSPPGALVMLLVIALLGMVVKIAIGYLAGSVRRAIPAVAITQLMQMSLYFFPWGMYGPSHLASLTNYVPQTVIMVLVMGFFAGAAAEVDDRSFRKRRLRNNDPAYLMAEIVRLQWRLNVSTQAACVMSVDVAGSTKMKAQADPLRVEYSFREYQVLVDEITRRYGSAVFSTAGDGAIVAFESAENAVQAGRALQATMPDFNERRSRLDRRFRIRVGIHSGETQAQLSEAPFNELIDIAAHIEKMAPVGGIAVSEAVVGAMPALQVVEMANKVDEHSVYFVSNPTGDD